MSLILRIFALILVMFVSRNADLLDSKVINIDRTEKRINADWEYLELNTKSVDEVMSRSGWEDVTLPHTWNQWDALDMEPGYRRDASWYKKVVEFSDIEDFQYILYFEGANITTDVYVNGIKAGRHVGGYVGFEVDITEFISEESPNEILVRVDNSYNREVIPSQKSDFFIYGGITRDVWLKKVPRIYLDRVLVSTPEVSKESGVVSLSLSVMNSEECTKCSVITRIIDPTNEKMVGEMTVSLNASEPTNFTLDEIENPHLWSPSEPHLYKVEIHLMQDGLLTDKIEEKVGFRWYSFVPHGPFMLNGERLLLRGTHRHEEHAGYGAAMPNVLHRKDIQMIKELGANFLRLGHYPQDPEVYRMCDELGIIVWDELPWCRGGIGNDKWKENTKRLLEEQIVQNYNHPSIFFWSMGNEIYWLPDFEGGDDPEKLNTFLTELNTLAQQLDPHRLTAIRKHYDGADLVDVFSPSIWSGWYAGVYTNYEKSIRESMAKYPAFLHMEYGGSSHVGRHTENPITGSGMLSAEDWEEVSNQVNIKNIAKEGDWTENYIVDLFDWHLSVSESFEGFTGNAQWAFKDFGTPLRPENAIPYMNQKGLVDRSGHPKDAYYVYQSYWSKKPMVYIESHTWTERQGPKNKSRAVSIYSNCEEVEFFLNGTSLGKRKRNMDRFPACGLTWDVMFKEGKNELVAKAYIKNEIVSEDEMIVQYSYRQSEKADHVGLSSQVLPNGNLLIEALMLDKNERRVLDYEERMYFSLDGHGYLLKNFGTPTGSQVVEMANGRAAIELVPGSGDAIIEARNQDFKGSYLTVKAPIKKTQALLSIQSFEYADETKTRVTGPYVNVSKVSIPKSLTGQNKWIMFEGPVLENDKIAYRMYADYRHRFDIYGKKVADLVMDTVSWNYHDIMDWGADILKVGNSLGMGSPGIYYQDSVYTLSDWSSKDVEIIKSGGDESILRTTFTGLKIEDEVFDVVQDWTLKSGDFWAGIHLFVKDGVLPKSMQWATGVVKHLPKSLSGREGDFTYLYSWGEQSYHHENLGMAVMANEKYGPQILEDNLSHLMVFKSGGHDVKYRFMARWENGLDGPTNDSEFNNQVLEACNDH